MSLPAEATAVIDYWFRELTPAQWFRGGHELDGVIRDRFGDLVRRARRGEFAGWLATPRGRLALIILLDQFPRHIHRGQVEAFASDGSARQLALQAIEVGEDVALNAAERQFLYMPLMHAEDETVQAQSLAAFARLRDEMNGVYGYAAEHAEQVGKFGRFPHRNAALGRASTPAEQEFLDKGGGSFR